MDEGGGSGSSGDESTSDRAVASRMGIETQSSPWVQRFRSLPQITPTCHQERSAGCVVVRSSCEIPNPDVADGRNAGQNDNVGRAHLQEFHSNSQVRYNSSFSPPPVPRSHGPSINCDKCKFNPLDPRMPPLQIRYGRLGLSNNATDKTVLREGDSSSSGKFQENIPVSCASMFAPFKSREEKLVYSENPYVSRGNSGNHSDYSRVKKKELEDLEPAQAEGKLLASAPSQQSAESSSGDTCSTESLPREFFSNLPSNSCVRKKVCKSCKIEKLGNGNIESWANADGATASMKEATNGKPSAAAENKFQNNCLYYDNIQGCSSKSGVSQPSVLEHSSDVNRKAIHGEYANGEKALHQNKFNSQTLLGVKEIYKSGHVCGKRPENVDWSSEYKAGSLNLPQTSNLWTSRFKARCLPNRAAQEESNLNGPLQGSLENVILRSISGDSKGSYEIQRNETKGKEPTLSSVLWLQHWRCSNIRLTKRLMRTCPDPSQKLQSECLIKASLDTNFPDASGSLRILQDPDKDDSVERG